MGTLAFAEASNRLTRSRDCLLLALGSMASALGLFLYLFAVDWIDTTGDMLIYSFLTLCINSWRVLTANILLSIVEKQLRSVASSFLLLVIHLIGDSWSPFWAGWLNQLCLDRFDTNNRNETSQSLATLAYCAQISLYPFCVLLGLAALFAAFASITFHSDQQRVDC